MFFSRKEYLDKKCTHQQYYDQFVTGRMKQFVLETFGKEHLKEEYEEDHTFNTIELDLWGRLASILPSFGIQEILRAHGDTWSISNGVSILKAAARQIVEENE